MGQSIGLGSKCEHRHGGWFTFDDDRGERRDKSGHHFSKLLVGQSIGGKFEREHGDSFNGKQLVGATAQYDCDARANPVPRDNRNVNPISHCNTNSWGDASASCDAVSCIDCSAHCTAIALWIERTSLIVSRQQAHVIFVGLFVLVDRGQMEAFLSP